MLDEYNNEYRYCPFEFGKFWTWKGSIRSSWEDNKNLKVTDTLLLWWQRYETLGKWKIAGMEGEEFRGASIISVDRNTSLACCVISSPSPEESIVSRNFCFNLPPVQDVLCICCCKQTPSVTLFLASNPRLWRQLLKLGSQICFSVCSASKDTYLHPVKTTHMHALTQTYDTKVKCTHNSPSACQDQKLFHWICHCPAFYIPPLCVCWGCWIFTDTIHLMSSVLSGLTVFTLALRAHPSPYKICAEIFVQTMWKIQVWKWYKSKNSFFFVWFYTHKTKSAV